VCILLRLAFVRATYLLQQPDTLCRYLCLGVLTSLNWSLYLQEISTDSRNSTLDAQPVSAPSPQVNLLQIFFCLVYHLHSCGSLGTRLFGSPSTNHYIRWPQCPHYSLVDELYTRTCIRIDGYCSSRTSRTKRSMGLIHVMCVEGELSAI